MVVLKRQTLRHLAEALSLGLAPIAAVDAMATLHLPGRDARTLAAIRTDMRAGLRLGEAVTAHRRLFPPAFVGAFDAADQSGDYRGAGSALLAAELRSDGLTWVALSRGAYLLLLLVGLIGLSGIHPELLGFAGAETATAPSVALGGTSPSGLVVETLARVLLIVGLAFGLATVFLRPWVDRVLAVLPGIGGARRADSVACAARTVATILKTRSSVPKALARAAEHPGLGRAGRRLRRSAERIVAGHDAATALEASGWLAEGLAPALTLGGDPDTMGRRLLALADHQEDIAQRRYHAALALYGCAGLALTALLVAMWMMGPYPLEVLWTF